MRVTTSYFSDGDACFHIGRFQVYPMATGFPEIQSGAKFPTAHIPIINRLSMCWYVNNTRNRFAPIRFDTMDGALTYAAER